MTAPRRTRPTRSPARRAAGSRPSAARGRPARPSAPARSRVARPPATPSTGTARAPLTSRAALLGLVVFTLVFSAVLPLRTFLEQRGEIAELERQQAAARERVAALEEQKLQLQDPAFVAAEARRRLHMARPGEVSYVVIPPTAPAPAPSSAPEALDGAEAPWWAQLWAGVEEADGGAAAP